MVPARATVRAEEPLTAGAAVLRRDIGFAVTARLYVLHDAPAIIDKKCSYQLFTFERCMLH